MWFLASTRKRVCMFALLAVAVFALVGCQPVPLRRNSSATRATARATGTRLRLANGSSLVVPAGWTVRSSTPGGLITAAPIDTGVHGEWLQSPLTRVSSRTVASDVELSVYGPKAGFGAELAQRQAEFSKRGSGASYGQPFAIGRANFLIDGLTPVTSFVDHLPGMPAQYDITLFIRPHGVDPVVVDSQFTGLPPSWTDTSVQGLSRSLLELLSFRAR